MRRVVTEGIVVRHRLSSLSSKATSRWKAHTADCRYAGSATESMADLIARLGVDKVRTRIAIGIVEACAYCKPVLLIEDNHDAG